MRDVTVALREHLEAVLASGVEEKNLLGVFLYGSQNYCTNLPNSDVDTKAIVIPTFEDLCLKPAVSQEIHLENGEHCEIKDIREIVKNFRKQNINFIEILYTSYCWVNHRYEDLWKHFFISNKEYISHYDINKCVQSICGQAIHTLKQNKTDGKKYSNGLRLSYFLNKYIQNISYIDCLIPEKSMREICRMYKAEESRVFESQTDQLIESFETLRKTSYENHYSKERIDRDILDKGTLLLIQRNMFDF